MIIASRILTCRQDGGDVEIPVHIHAPERADVDWRCRFEIGWPQEAVIRWGTGVDAIQALLFALQMIGAEINTSPLHGQGRLTWLAPRGGYGFPVPDNIRDLLAGDDV